MSLFPFALIPAAGLSLRMGTPKLLLKVGERTVIARLLDALKLAGIASRFVVINPDDEPLRIEVARNGGDPVLAPDHPPDMKSSIAHGLRDIGDRLEADGIDADPDSPWLLIPGDYPNVTPEIVKLVLDAAQTSPGRIVVPTYEGRRGHPTLFAWKHATQIDAIPPTEGFNWLLKEYAADVLEIAVGSIGVVTDLDTPDDYLRLRSGGSD